MGCNAVVGVKNILLKFTNCDTGQEVGPIAHELAKEDLPAIRSYDYKNEALPGGKVKRHHISAEMEMSVIRDDRIPLADYQGRSAVDVQVEYINGLVYTGRSGSVTGDDKSDTHEVMLKMTFLQLSELLPPGAIAQP